MLFLLIVLAAIAWAALSFALAVTVALLIRMRGNYPEGESFKSWRNVTFKHVLFGGYGLVGAGFAVGYIYRVREGLSETPAWVENVVWLTEHWWVILIVGVLALLGFAGWWLWQHREVVVTEDTPDLSPAVPHPDQQMTAVMPWSLDPNTPHWQTGRN